MLDMGFIHDVRKILQHLPMRRQNLFFSATMAPSIMELANKILKDPISIEVTPNSSTVETIDQSLYTVTKENKRELLLHLLRDPKIKSAIVFSKTKHGANKIEKILAQANIPSAAIHGNKSQSARQNALAKLKNGQIRILVATDIAARGIDVDLLSHVIIYDVPLEPESYVHRIGRTGRAQATGEAIMFCEPEELKYLQQVLKLIGKEIPLVTDHPYHHKMSLTARPSSTPKEPKPDRGPRPSKVRYDRSPKDSGRRDANTARPLSDAPRRSDRNDRPKSNTANKSNNPSKSGRYY
jgi:ATP-dependent RNA helicase RhlE